MGRYEASATVQWAGITGVTTARFILSLNFLQTALQRLLFVFLCGKGWGKRGGFFSGNVSDIMSTC